MPLSKRMPRSVRSKEKRRSGAAHDSTLTNCVQALAAHSFSRKKHAPQQQQPQPQAATAAPGPVLPAGVSASPSATSVPVPSIASSPAQGSRTTALVCSLFSFSSQMLIWLIGPCSDRGSGQTSTGLASQVGHGVRELGKVCRGVKLFWFIVEAY